MLIKGSNAWLIKLQKGVNIVNLIITKYSHIFMANVEKVLAVFIFLIFITSSLVKIGPVNSQVGVTNPSIPSFGVTLKTYSNYIPPIYGVDASTGKAILIKEGYTEEEKWVDVQIGSQPFIRYTNSASQPVSLYYDVRWKGENDTSWLSYPHDSPYQYYEAVFGDSGDSQPIGCLISIGFSGIKGPVNGNMQLLDPEDERIDFQVEALIGYYNSAHVFVGQSSGWSNTQTLTINNGVATNNVSPTPIATTDSSSRGQTPVSGESIRFSLDFLEIIITILFVLVVILLVFVVFYLRRRR
jgi:hypothetical protein